MNGYIVIREDCKYVARSGDCRGGPVARIEDRFVLKLCPWYPFTRGMSKSQIRTLKLQISEAARQMQTARTFAEAKCLQETIDACRAKIAKG